MFYTILTWVIIYSWGIIAPAYSQIEKDQIKSSGFSDLWISTAIINAPKYRYPRGKLSSPAS